MSVRAVDRAGNVSPASAAFNVVVNNVDMTIALTAPTAGIRVRDQIVAKATTSEPVKRVVFTGGSVSVTDDTPPYEAALDISGQPEGAATITATATGLLDETATTTLDFVIDRTPPSAPDASLICAEPPDNGNALVFGPPGTVESGASVNLTNVNTGATAKTAAGTDGAFSTFLAAAVGDTVSIVAVDSAGNIGPASTVSVRASSCMPAKSATLTYDGVIADRVGLVPGALSPDGLDDAVFELTFDLGAGITRPLSFIELQGPTGRSTRPEVGAGLGVCNSTDLGSPFLNQADGTISASLTSSVSLLLFASAGNFVQAGAVYTVTAVFTNGTRYTGSVTIPATQSHEVTSSSFSVSNESLPLDPNAPLPTGSSEVMSDTFSVSNETLPLDPNGPPVSGSNEVMSDMFSVSNQELPLDPNLPLAAGSSEVMSNMFSVSNQSLPLDPNAPPAAGGSEVMSALFSVSNQWLPLDPNAPPIAGSSEVMSSLFSVNNDPNAPMTPATGPVGSQASPGLSCADVLARGGSTGNGSYWLKPGSSAAFQTTCQMSILGGGWTLLGQEFLKSMDDTSSKQYLYVWNERWYVSPATTKKWSWTAGQEVTGAFGYGVVGLDAGAASFACPGSTEKPAVGIGCSTGPGATQKVLPNGTNDPVAGSCTICQDLPNVFGGGVCQAGVAIYVRATADLPDGGVVDAATAGPDAGGVDEAVDGLTGGP